MSHACIETGKITLVAAATWYHTVEIPLIRYPAFLLSKGWYLGETLGKISCLKETHVSLGCGFPKKQSRKIFCPYLPCLFERAFLSLCILQEILYIWLKIWQKIGIVGRNLSLPPFHSQSFPERRYLIEKKPGNFTHMPLLP